VCKNKERKNKDNRGEHIDRQIKKAKKKIEDIEAGYRQIDRQMN
jgi:hypothetical protein